METDVFEILVGVGSEQGGGIELENVVELFIANLMERPFGSESIVVKDHVLIVRCSAGTRLAEAPAGMSINV